MTSILFLTVMPSPYQRQLFARMAEHPSLTVAVRYFVAAAHDREWARTSLYPHEAVMPGRTLSLVGKSAHWNPGILRLLRGDNSDLVVVSDYSAPTVQLAMRVLAARGRPWMFWGEIPGFNARGRLGTWMRDRLQAPLRAASGIAGIGSGAVDAYRRLFPGKPVHNIPYFCDLAPYAAARAAAPPRTGETVDVLFSGQLIERKGVDVLLDAFTPAARAHGRLRLLLLGGGPARQRLEASVPADLRERVLFIGHREPDQLPDVFARADVFCLPSRHDGWGVVVNEALGAGLPVLVSDAVGAGRDLVRDGENGFVTPAGDAGALAIALERIAADDALRARMATASSVMGQSWTLDEGVARWMAAAETIISGRRTG